MVQISSDMVPADLTMSAPDITDRERALVASVLAGPQLSMGHFTQDLEEQVARVAGRSFGIAVSSGTSALHLLVRALGLKPGDKVVTTSFSFVASTNCLLYEGVEPIFADIDQRTLNIDPASIAEVVARRSDVRAILPVHVFGQPCEMDPIMDIARMNGLAIIEDACEAIGASYLGRPAGSFGSGAAFAFYPNKQMTTGEGGVIVTDEARIADECRSLRNQGRGNGDDWLTHLRLGYNYRLDEMSAALGVAQVARLDELLARRNEVAATYSASLAQLKGVVPVELSPSTTRMSWFVFVVILDRRLNRDRVAELLATDKIPTRPYFKPIHRQPYFVDRFGSSAQLPVTDDVSRRTLALPFHSRLSSETIGYVVTRLGRAIERSG